MTEIGTVWAAELRRAVRSARVIVLLGLYSMFSGLLLLIVGSIATAIRLKVDTQIARTGINQDAAATALAESRKSFLGFLFSDDSAMLEALSQVPMVILVVFKMTLVFLPAYIALMGFDQISGEVGPRSMRYLTIRARRSSVLYGKYLAQASVLLGLVLLVDLGIFLYARVITPDFTTGAMVSTLLRFWLAAIVFSLSYLALTTLCSALFRTPAVSLIFNFIALFVFWLVDGQHFWMQSQGTGPEDGPQSPWGYLKYFSPSNYATDLLDPALKHFAQSTGAYVAFAGVFLLAAHLVLRRRDL